ncbi:MAG: hypothetical protein V3T96_02235 [Thermodesulfobacteriota bacterium]
MELDYTGWKRGVGSGVVAGIIWGWVAMVLNTISGVFPFESSLFHNLISFSVGGAVIGIVVGVFLAITSKWLPFKGFFTKAVFVSTSIWILLSIGGFLLSAMSPWRYNALGVQAFQGLVLALILGCILGTVWKVYQRKGV